jgi:hypothetical protein
MNLLSCRRSLCLIALFLLTHALLSEAQSKPRKQTHPPAKAKPADQPAKPPSVATVLQNRVVTDADQKEGLRDSVPCEFSRDELFKLRPAPEVLTLSAEDEERLRARVVAEALAQADAGTLAKEKAGLFAEAISREPFEGLTPSQAFGRVLSLLGVYTEESADVIGLRNASRKPDTEYSAYVVEKFGQPDQKSKLTQDLKGKSRAETDQAVAGNPDSFKPGAAKAIAEAQNPPSSTGNEQVAQAARNEVGAIARPPDVGCSMAILSWNGALYAFGRSIANEFIVVQIVVRNLNPDKEFLLHDAEFAVDADINGRLGRFASGVDKLTARGFMLGSRDYSYRGLTLHIAQGVGTLLSGVSLVYGSAWKDAANVYSGGFMTALNGVLPDHNTEHLNLLNDEGFSSYRTERTVVPKSGTAEFVIFIPSKQFDEGWWVQDCAHQTVIKKWPKLEGKDEAYCVGQFNNPIPDPKCTAPPQSVSTSMLPGEFVLTTTRRTRITRRRCIR